MTAIFINTLPGMICIDVMSTFSCCPQNDWIHSQQVWVSGDKRYWNNLMTVIFMNRYMICIDEMWTWRGNAPQNRCIHNEQVWISGYQPYWNNQMTAISMKTLPDMIYIDVMSTLHGMPFKMIVSTIRRYEFQVINVIGTRKRPSYIIYEYTPGYVCVDV